MNHNLTADFDMSQHNQITYWGIIAKLALV